VHATLYLLRIYYGIEYKHGVNGDKTSIKGLLIMDWLQKALEKSKQSEITDFQFKTSSLIKESFSAENKSNQSEINNPAIEVTPPNPLDERLLLTKQSDTHSIAAYNILAAKTLSLLRGLGAHTLAITSPKSGAGNTLTAANLAISIARSLHDTVVLVELDLRKPVFYRYFGLNDSDQGLSDHLTDAAELADILIKISGTNLTLLPAGTALDKHPNILGSPLLRQFVRDISSLYNDHLIIFDVPALLDTDDALAFIPNVSASLLVLEEGVNTAQQVYQCTDILKNHGLLGTILNKAENANSL
jgi:Mrp family chromosome partitioning ATPase